ncbi:amino acid adenylation domain-containing protein [Streptacidiphilus sp. ASG 303]|uniref:non-ribosomal peptide synthetase n=1 Tax=Streptacidiphilus sp. ASG 303 TaxID=2896847 RepID=UPI001E6133BE|nr:non-ribosomal peptide synthetase [Streptacidiphilus sp. ASG 303]MCD0485147.1 amino acid adenylation domain-containing protein [Streptacidiphilus sp. ASG 303]
MLELFDWSARRFPEAAAMVDGSRRIGYRQLDLASDDFAARLEDAGVGHGDLVPLLLPRGPELVVGMLAVLKRGAAYAALDPRWPRDRIAGLLDQLSARVLVTAEAGPWAVPVAEPPGDPRQAPASGHRRPSPVQVGGDDACSVFFTSGTSGVPKAVLSPHRGVARLWDDCEFSDFGPGSAIVQVAPTPWDGFTYDCWGALLCGGTVVFAESPLLPGTLRRLVGTEGLTHVFVTTAVFHLIVEEGIGAFAGLRKVMVGGEKVSPAHVLRFMEAHPGTGISNVYGPVECTVIATERVLTREDCADPAGLPLGRPLANTEVHVLDGDRVCDVDEDGEICLGGDGLALGYLRDPELTARKFTEVEVGGRRTRLYRTGDRGRWSRDGVLYIGGRLDRQVKMRGLRIELEEVEACAAGAPGVADPAVVPVTGADGACTALGLFFTGRGPGAPDGAGLRAYLEARLPDYMVPGRIERLDRLPLNANGKVDRAALAERARAARAAEAGAVGAAGAAGTPADAAEQRVAAAFAEVLGVDRVPVGASFFDLGGSSLDAARVCARLGGPDLPVEAAQLYRTPDVRSLAAWLEAHRTPERAAGPETARRVGLTSMQDLFLVRDESDTLLWQVGGAVDRAALRAALGDLHRRHQGLHARYRSLDAPVALLPEDPGEPEFRELPAADPAEARAAVEAALREPLDIAEGLVWRAAAAGTADGGTLLGLTVHHVAFDRWSSALITEDLGRAYTARTQGREPDFPAPAAGLAEANAEHRRYLALVDLDGQRAFWRDTLRGLTELAVPGRRRSWEPTGPLAVHRTGLAGAGYGADAEPPGFATLFAAVVRVLRTVTGQQDVAVAVPVARRGGRLMDAAVTNRVDVLCLRAAPDGGGPELAPARAAEIVNRALAHQELPFREAAMALAEVQDVGPLLNLPLFSVHDSRPAEPALAGLPVRRLERPELRGANQLTVEIDLRAEDGPEVVVSVRTDVFPAELAELVATGFVRALRTGRVPAGSGTRG